MNIIEIDKYSIKNTDNKIFIKDLSLNIKEGDVLGIAGKSGAGKTLLALSIAGITQSGIKASGVIKRNYKKDKKISILFQNPLNQIFSMKVYDEIKGALYLSGNDISEENIKIISKTWEIEGILNKRVDKLSLGEAQRVAITSIMVSNPDLIILDEPFQYVDNSIFKENLLNIKKANPKIVIIIIEHNYHMLNQLSDEILYIGEKGYYSLLTEIDYPKVEPTYFKSKHDLPDASFAFNGIYFSYGKEKIFSDFYFKQNKKFLIIDGKNGSGKSTLMKILIRVLKQKKGDVFYYLGDKTIKNSKLKDVRNKLGYIFQNPDYQIFANTVEDEIYYGVERNNKLEDYINYWLKEFNLENLLQKSPHTLSYGERRRVNFLSSTINIPQIIIYDEPTVGLDYENRKVLLKFMEYHNNNGVSQILISHDRWFKELIKGYIERITL